MAENPIEKIQWADSKMQYICDPAKPTLEHLAELHGETLNALLHRSAREKWREQREEFQGQLRESVAHEISQEFSAGAKARLKEYLDVLFLVLDRAKEGIDDKLLEFRTLGECARTIVASVNALLTAEKLIADLSPSADQIQVVISSELGDTYAEETADRAQGKSI